MGVYKGGPTHGSSARHGVAHPPDPSTAVLPLHGAQYGSSVHWKTVLRHLPREHRRPKTGKCENQIRKRIAQIAGLPADKEAAALVGAYELKTSTQLDVDRHRAISREIEMVRWMAASL